MKFRLNRHLHLFLTLPLSAAISAAAGADGLGSLVSIPKNGEVAIRSLDSLSPAAKSALVESQRHSDNKVSPAGVIERTEDDESVFTSMKRMVSASKPTINQSLIKVKLARLGPAFSAFRLAGYIPEGTRMEGPWTWVTRAFEAPDGRILKLSEWDFRVDGGGLLFIKEYLNQEVKGEPATLTVSVSPKGRTLWSMVWAHDGKQYTLSLTADNQSLDGKGQILALANSVLY